MNWWEKVKNLITGKSSSSSGKQAEITMKSVDYHPKIILAWVECLNGNQEITNWLLENNYREIVMASSAVYLRDEARNWLMENGYPHLMAFINAAEGNESAGKWLNAHGFEQLFYMALAIDNDKKGWDWLISNSSEDIFLLCKTINRIKNQIEENHNDIHSIHKD